MLENALLMRNGCTMRNISTQHICRHIGFSTAILDYPAEKVLIKITIS